MACAGPANSTKARLKEIRRRIRYIPCTLLCGITEFPKFTLQDGDSEGNSFLVMVRILSEARLTLWLNPNTIVTHLLSVLESPNLFFKYVHMSFTRESYKLLESATNETKFQWEAHNAVSGIGTKSFIAYTKLCDPKSSTDIGTSHILYVPVKVSTRRSVELPDYVQRMKDNLPIESSPAIDKIPVPPVSAFKTEHRVVENDLEDNRFEHVGHLGYMFMALKCIDEAYQQSYFRDSWFHPLNDKVENVFLLFHSEASLGETLTLDTWCDGRHVFVKMSSRNRDVVSMYFTFYPEDVVSRL